MATNPEDGSAAPKPSQSSLGQECLAGGGEMGALMRSMDWEKTGLGPVAGWPRSLKTMVAVMLANRFPMLIWWGPELLSLYNDAYRPVLGIKHPASMGAPCQAVWSEIWDFIGPMIGSVRAGGPATFHEHLQLFLNSRGVGEETFHTFSYSPIPDDDGGIGGVLNTVQETTEQVQDDRQLRMLRDLAARSADAKSAEEACRTAARILSLNDSDLPFSLFYLQPEGGDSGYVDLVSASGLSDYDGPARPQRVALREGADAGWPFRAVELSGREAIVDHLTDRFGTLPKGRWGEPPERAVVLPLSRPGYPRLHGFFVAGVSSRRKLDERYLGLFRLTADQVMTAIANARVYEEARRQLEQSRAIEQELRHAAEAANRAKDEFLAMLGHELRNPLAPISTALHLMRLRGVTVIERERVVIERQVAHLIRLVDDLLDVSRITRGKVELQRKRVEIAEAVAKAVEMASPMLEQRQHHLALEVPPRGLSVDGDLTRLAQVLANLLTNAAKYTEPGGHIAVAARREGEQVVLTVTDDGMGITAEILPHIFELFMQERQALDRSSGGLGLGLAIVRSLVTMHGGTVDAHSEGRGRGSVFTVRLPAAAPPREAAPAGGAGAGSATSGAGRTILVVDDNEDAAEVLAAGLELLGHQTRVAHDGPAALRVLADFKPDIALLDIGLPVMDGYELARRLRQDPSLAHTRLVAVTGYGQDSDRRRSKEAGFDAHLVKPIQLPELDALINNLGEAAASTERRG